MKTARWMMGLFLLMSASSLFAQMGRGGKGAEQQMWLKFWKDLNLQSRCSADMEVQAMGMTMAGKLYRLDEQTRTEMTVPITNLRMAVLQVEKNGQPVAYSIFPDQKKYCVNPLPKGGDEKTPAFKISEQGTEVYGNETCTKRRLSFTLADGTAQTVDMLFAPSKKNMPVKITALVASPSEQPMVVTTLFKNYRFTAPDASLFVVPGGYTQAANVQEVMMESLSGGAQGGQPDLNALIRQFQKKPAQ